MYLELKFHQDRCDWYIYKLKKLQNSRIKVFTEKQATTKVSVIFLNSKMLKEMQQRCF